MASKSIFAITGSRPHEAMFERKIEEQPQSGESEMRPIGRAALTTICKSFGQLEYGANETEAIAALLHDAVEDCGGVKRLRDTERKFEKKVARIVEGCTDADQTPKPPWRKRKQNYIAHLKRASASTRLVSAADKLHHARAILRNLREEGDNLWSRFNGGKKHALWYYRSFVSAFCEHGSNKLIEELDRVVTQIERPAE